MTDYISHFGIRGQKWGVKNGPPYPLGSDVSTGRRLKEKWPIRSGAYKTKDKKSNSYDHSDSKYKANVAKFIASAAVNVIFLNPVGAAYNVKRAMEYIDSKSRLAVVNKTLENAGKVDKKIGLPKKNKDYTPEQDLKMVNPEFHNFDENTKNNCMLCTMTYELRRRGYEVTAGKASKGYYDEDSKRWFQGAKSQQVYNMRSQKNPGLALYSNDGIKEAITKMNSLEKGSRGNIAVTWKPGYGSGGHSMHYEITDSGMIIRDGQTGKTYTNPYKILKHTMEISYTRLDNLKINAKNIKEVVRK